VNGEKGKREKKKEKGKKEKGDLPNKIKVMDQNHKYLWISSLVFEEMWLGLP
jgi:hypothetical protein